MRYLALLLCISLATPWVIYKRNHKRKLVCREETEWSNSTTAEEQLLEVAGRRNRRDVAVDPELKQPIIYLGVVCRSSDGRSANFQVKPTDPTFIDDGDFDVVSEYLSKAELAQVKKRIMETCNALNANGA